MERVWKKIDFEQKRSLNHAFLVGVKRGNMDFVKHMLEMGADVCVENGRALLFSARTGNVNMLKFLLSLGEFNNQNRCLQDAAEHGHLAIVEYLLQNGADVHADNDRALRISSYRGHLPVVKCLIKAGASVHVEKNRALLNALIMKKWNTAECLLQAGAIFDDPKKIFLSQRLDIKKLFLNATCSSHLNLMELCLNLGFDIHSDDTPLACASQKGDLDVVKFLLKHGANIFDYMIRSASSGKHSDVVACLVEGRRSKKKMESIFLDAARNGNLCIVEECISQKVNIGIRDDLALTNAAENGHSDIVQCLINHRANVHANSNLALRMSVYRHHTRVTEILLEAGADPNTGHDASFCRNLGLGTCLKHATEHNQPEVVTLLLKAKGNPNIGPAVRTAVVYNRHQILEMLLEHWGKCFD